MAVGPKDTVKFSQAAGFLLNQGKHAFAENAFERVFLKRQPRYPGLDQFRKHGRRPSGTVPPVPVNGPVNADINAHHPDAEFI
jgi:hypothetical protein